MCFDHISLCPQLLSDPLLLYHPPNSVYFLYIHHIQFLLSIWSWLCGFCWIVADLPGTKENWLYVPQKLSVTPEEGEGTVCPTLLFMLGLCLIWAYTGVGTWFHSCYEFKCASTLLCLKTVFPCGHAITLSLRIFHAFFCSDP